MSIALLLSIIRYSGNRLSNAQRRIVVKSLVLPIVDYVIHLQPQSKEVNGAADKLEVHYLRWVLGVKVGKSNILAARAWQQSRQWEYALRVSVPE